MPIQMLCSATFTVRCPIRTADAALDRSSRMITTSADSPAAVEPRAPMAIPTSATARTGASLTPSPTIMTGRRGRDRTASTLSGGRHSARTSVRPASAAMCSAVASASPVSMTVRVTPSGLQLGQGAAGFPPDRVAHHQGADEFPGHAHVDGEFAAGQFRLHDAGGRFGDKFGLADHHVAAVEAGPDAVRGEFAWPPWRSRRPGPRFRAASITEAASTWEEYCSAEAASPRTSSSVRDPAVRTPTRAGRP